MPAGLFQENGFYAAWRRETETGQLPIVLMRSCNGHPAESLLYGNFLNGSSWPGARIRWTEKLPFEAKQKAQAFQAWASQIFGFVAIDRSNAAFAVWVLRNHLVLRRATNHVASSRVVALSP